MLVGDICVCISRPRKTYWALSANEPPHDARCRIKQHAIQTHRIHGAGIYGNIWGILMGSMLHHVTIYSSTMDPSWETISKLH